MHTSLERHLPNGLVVVALLAGPFVSYSAPEVHEQFERTIPFDLGGHFSIDNVNGSISIETWNEASVRIEAEKTADSEDSLRDIEIIVTGEGNRVEVHTRYPQRSHRGRSRAVDYRIWLPTEADLDAETVNGRVEVSGVRGRVNTSTVNGSVELVDLAGVAEVSTTNGSIKARYREAVDGTHRFSTTNGSVTIYLPDGTGGELDAETVNGSITTDFPATIEKVSKRHLRGSFGGGGGGYLEINTVNGSVKILQQ